MNELLQYLTDNHQTANALTAIVALIVASISLVTAITTALIQRRHNHNSVTPIAEFIVGDYEDHIEVSLTNRGTGPLIIRWFIATRLGESKKSLVEHMHTPALEGIGWSTFTGDLGGRTLAPSDTKKIILLRGDESDTHFQNYRDEVRRILKDALVEVNFTDIYGRRFPAKIEHLAWFGRRLNNDA